VSDQRKLSSKKKAAITLIVFAVLFFILGFISWIFKNILTLAFECLIGMVCLCVGIIMIANEPKVGAKG
jgi:uncharacterized membrane protein HdeD (DUF308 family)